MRKKILVVEDQAVLALGVKKKLGGFDYEPYEASSGERAMEFIGEHPDTDLILMDIDLGKGMDGTEAARRILEVKDIPIVFLTAHAEREMVEKVKGITRYGYVLKNSGDFVLRSSIEMAFELFDANRQLKQTNAELRKSEELFRKMIETCPDSVILFEISRTEPCPIVVCNKRTAIMHGYSLEELQGKTVADLNTVWDLAGSIEWFEALKREGLLTGVVDHRKKDGSAFTVEYHVSYVCLGGVEYYIAVDRESTCR
jgi:PAS domain S-box-containing protein